MVYHRVVMAHGTGRLRHIGIAFGRDAKAYMTDSNSKTGLKLRYFCGMSCEAEHGGCDYGRTEGVLDSEEWLTVVLEVMVS